MVRKSNDLWSTVTVPEATRDLPGWMYRELKPKWRQALIFLSEATLLRAEALKWEEKRSSSSSGSVISEFEPGDNQLHDTDRATELIPFLCLRSLNARRFYLPGPRMSVIYFTTFLRDLVCISSFEPELKLKLKLKLKLIRCSIILKFFIRFSWLLPRTSFLWLPFHPKLIYCSRDNFLLRRKKTFAMESRLHHNDKLVFVSTKKLK